MLLTVLEPAYFSPQSDFAKALQADVVVWANAFRFRRQSTIHRAAIKTVGGKKWLTIPVIQKGLLGQSIEEAKLSLQTDWRTTHQKTLEINYHLTPYYDFYAERINAGLQIPEAQLDPLLRRLFQILAPARLWSRLILSTGLDVCADRSLRISRWLQQTGCDSYLLRPLELNLIDVADLKRQGIQLYTFDFSPPIYSQSFQGFIPNLATIDLFCNEGPATTDCLHQAGRVTKV